MAVIDLVELSKSHYRNRAGNCYSDRQPWPCERWQDAETINALTAEVNRLSGLVHSTADANRRFMERADRAEQRRDAVLLNLASALDAGQAFRIERDEAREALAHLTGVSL